MMRSVPGWAVLAWRTGSRVGNPAAWTAPTAVIDSTAAASTLMRRFCFLITSNSLLGHGSNQHCGHHSLTTPGRPSRDCRDLPRPSLQVRRGVGGRRRDGVAYQPKPAPTPTELSSLLKAPPKVTVARSLIARW